MSIEMQNKETTMKYVKQKHKNPFSYVANCQTCGNFFFVRDRTDAKKRKYCNNFCQHGGESNKVNKLCQQCGKPFSTTLSKIKNGRGKFCSQKCLNRSKELEKVPCPICNTLFTPIKQGNGKRKQYCSIKCSSIGQKKKLH